MDYRKFNTQGLEHFSRDYGSRRTSLHLKEKSPTPVLTSSWLDTPLGKMIAIADEHQLYLLEFADGKGIEREIRRMQEKAGSIVPGRTRPIESIEEELSQYFNGQLKTFATPLCLFGTPFQKSVWQELIKIPFGQTRSYAGIAATLGNPFAFRGVGQANGANKLVIIIPCHRVINAGGQLGGYGGSLPRKKWLLDHESKLS